MQISEAWRIVRRLSFKEALGAAWLCLRHPLYVQPTWRATQRTVELCDMHYPNIHHLHNTANAIRHVLWNVLIVKYCAKGELIPQAVIDWTRTITDWHERFAVNPPLERKMDLHNNALGRSWSPELHNRSEQEIMETLEIRSQHAVKVNSLTAPWKSDSMVYIDN
jgi:hypothetical protein